MKEQLPAHEHFIHEHKDHEDLAELSDRLAPPEETESNEENQRQFRDDDGSMLIDTGALKLPQGFDDNESEKRGIFGLEPVIVAILVLSIVFIVLIAYLVYKMPAPVK